MREKIRQHRLFFMGFLLFLAGGAALLAFVPPGEEIFFFSGHRSLAGDWFFRYITKMGEEWAYLLFGLVLLFVRYRYVLLLPVTGLVVTLMAGLSKALFRHPRPGAFLNHPDWLDRVVLIEGVDLHSGMTSFPSGHTMSAFALYTVLALMFRRGKALDLFFLALAVLVGLSRIYLVQHFLKDVIMGASIGVVLGLLIFALQRRWWPYRPDRWYDKSLNSIRGRSA